MHSILIENIFTDVGRSKSIPQSTFNYFLKNKFISDTLYAMN